ncbi:hypothetical protein HYU19_03450, partial [Candidatus Woesearchaeota archaeon]|nr:hypothetical protein [Candidatus Woesearchaeota archaeon]
YPNATKILVLEHDGQVIAGFSGTLKTDDTLTYLSPQELDDATAQFQQHDYQAMRGKNYKLFIFSIKAFDQLSEQVYFHGQEHNTSTIRTILLADDTSEEYASYIVDQKITAGKLGERYRDAAKVQLIDEIRKGFGDDAFLRGAIFSSLFSAAILEEGQPFVLRGMKEGTAVMYPEEAMFRLLRFVPLALLKDTLAAPPGPA